MPLATFLMSMVGPLVARFLTLLGLSFFVYQGMDIALQSFIDAVSTSFNSLPASALSLLRLSGITEGLSIVGSAFATRLLIITLKSTSVFLGKSPS